MCGAVGLAIEVLQQQSHVGFAVVSVATGIACAAYSRLTVKLVNEQACVVGNHGVWYWIAGVLQIVGHSSGFYLRIFL